MVQRCSSLMRGKCYPLFLWGCWPLLHKARFLLFLSAYAPIISVVCGPQGSSRFRQCVSLPFPLSVRFHYVVPARTHIPGHGPLLEQSAGAHASAPQARVEV